MKFLFILATLMCLTHILAMPQKDSSSDDDYTSIRSNGLGPLHGHYPVYVLPSDRHNVDELRGLSEVTKQPSKRLKNPFYKQTLDSIGSGYVI